MVRRALILVMVVLAVGAMAGVSSAQTRGPIIDPFAARTLGN
jgi:hypothetical protein